MLSILSTSDGCIGTLGGLVDQLRRCQRRRRLGTRQERTMDNYHVIHTENGWELHPQGSTEAVLTAKRKEDLLGQLPGYMEGKVASVKIHNREGRIEDERSYPRTSDPRRSKG
jgi:hypothetical protein